LGKGLGIFIYMYIHTQIMATKTIAIMDDVYGKLKAMKKPDESFSDELRRLLATKGKLSDVFGAWKDVDEQEAQRREDLIRKMRGLDKKRSQEIMQ